LATVLALLEGSGINVEYMYAFLERHKDNAAIIVFRFEDPQRAIDTLLQANMKVFTADEIAAL